MAKRTLTARDLEMKARKAGLTVRHTSQATIVESPEGRPPVFLPRGNGPLPKGLVRAFLRAMAALLRK